MRVYLDTNAIIGAIEGDDSLRASIWALFAVDRGNVDSLVTSELTIAEVLVKPLQLGQDTIVTTYLELLRSGDRMSVVPVDRDVLILAARWRKDRSVKLPDAIHLATAERANCQVVLTSDDRLARASGLRQVAVSKTSVDDLVSTLP